MTFFDRWLLAACAVFGLQGLSWVALGSFDPLGLWDRLLAEAFYEGATPPEVERFRRFILAPLGATTAAYFAVLAAVVRGPFRRREPWAFAAVLGSAWLWFTVDSAASLAHGARFNVLLVNVPCIVLLTIPLLALRGAFRGAPERVGDRGDRETGPGDGPPA